MIRSQKCNTLVSIIICTFDRPEFVLQLLQNIRRLELISKIEVLVIDNNKFNFSKELKEFQCKDYIYNYHQEREVGLSAARNRGVRESNSKYVIFVDDDAILPANLIERFIKIWEENRSLILGARILPFFEFPRPAWLTRKLLGFYSCEDLGVVDHYPTYWYPAGVCFGLLKEDIKNAGFFDTYLGRNGNRLISGEETDLCQRVEKKFARQRFYVGSVTVRHSIHKERLTVNWITRRVLNNQYEFDYMVKRTWKEEIRLWVKLVYYLSLWTFSRSLEHKILYQLNKNIIFKNDRNYI